MAIDDEAGRTDRLRVGSLTFEYEKGSRYVMSKPWMRKKAHIHTPLWFVFTCLVVFSLAACGSNGGTGSTPTPTTTPFKVTSVDMAVSPQNITGTSCGTTITVTYTATFHLVPNGPGGTIQFLYTTNNGRSSTNASMTVGPGQTLATYSFTWTGQATADHVYPGPGGVMTTSPNAVSSALVKPQGVCS
ncbi:MAG TPA: hypothetical protein VEI53_15205 [Ktedonobacteraceae bacterium]|nr:hypothetical protein [Ktedonobacteraceae bacterium]